MSAYTPGPWHERADSSVWPDSHGIYNEYSEAIAHTTRGWSEEMQNANARLIAAAPALAAALQECLDAMWVYSSPTDGWKEIIEEGRAILKSAGVEP